MTRILVGLKRVMDYNVNVRVKSDGSGVETEGIKMSINPFDEIALEEALQIKEAGGADEVVVVTVGVAAAQQQLRTGLAMGADRAILVETDQELQPLGVAKILKKLADKESASLVILGKQSIDGDNNQTGQMLAALWERPQATFVSKLTIDGDKAKASREVDAGIETVEIDLPAVITVDLRLNEPRYVKLPDILKAKKKPLEEVELEELKLDLRSTCTASAYAPPEPRSKGIMVDDVTGLVNTLRDKGLVT